MDETNGKRYAQAQIKYDDYEQEGNEYTQRELKKLLDHIRRNPAAIGTTKYYNHFVSPQMIRDAIVRGVIAGIVVLYIIVISSQKINVEAFLSFRRPMISKALYERAVCEPLRNFMPALLAAIVPFIMWFMLMSFKNYLLSVPHRSRLGSSNKPPQVGWQKVIAYAFVSSILPIIATFCFTFVVLRGILPQSQSMCYAVVERLADSDLANTKSLIFGNLFLSLSEFIYKGIFEEVMFFHSVDTHVLFTFTLYFYCLYRAFFVVGYNFLTQPYMQSLYAWAPASLLGIFFALVVKVSYGEVLLLTLGVNSLLNQVNFIADKYFNEPEVVQEITVSSDIDDNGIVFSDEEE